MLAPPEYDWRIASPMRATSLDARAITWLRLMAKSDLSHIHVGRNRHTHAESLRATLLAVCMLL